MKYCTKCGKELLDDAIICPGCGCAVNNRPQAAHSQAPEQKESSPSEQQSIPTSAKVLGIFSIIFGSLSIAVMLIIFLTLFQISPIVLSFIGYALGIIGMFFGSKASKKDPNNGKFTTEINSSGKTVIKPIKNKWSVTTVGAFLSMIGMVNVGILAFSIITTLAR